MTEESATPEEKRRQNLERYKTSVLELLKSMRKCSTNYYYLLGSIRQQPMFLQTFSSESIININQVERSIPTSVAMISNFIEIVSWEDSERIKDQDIQATMADIQNWFDELVSFMNFINEAMPKESEVSIFLRSPVAYLRILPKLMKQKSEVRKQQKILDRKEKKHKGGKDG